MKPILFLILTIFLLASCASQPTDRSKTNAEQLTRLKTSSRTWNLAPKEKFSNFDHFEIMEVKLAKPLQSNPKKLAVSTTAGKVITDKLDQLFSNWNKQSSGGRTLIIEPTLTHFRIISRSARFWAGGFAGDSRAQIDVVIREKSNDQIIANPFFYQQANAIAAAWSFGGHDQSIPGRLATLLEKYMNDNYTDLIGSPTGNDY